MKDEQLPITGFNDPKGNQFGLRDMEDIFNIEEITKTLRPAIKQLRAEIAEREWEEELAGDPKYGALYSHKNKCAIIRFLRLGWRLSDPGVPDCNCK